MVTCDCDGETDVTETVYRDPQTGRDHVQHICCECGERVEDPANGRMV